MAESLPPSLTVDEILSRADIVSLIGEYVSLKKSGKSYRALCPFHPERSPSFYVEPQKQFFYCFSCSQGGNIFTFLMLHENLSFPEAVQLVAERQGIQWKQVRGKHKAERGVDEALQKIMEEALSFYQKKLKESPKDGPCMSFLRERGVHRETQEVFGFGYAPDGWDNLLKDLAQAGFDPRLVEKSGLIVSRQEGSGYYDRFRGRVMIPIRSRLGKCLAFGGRILGDGEPKYLNSPETVLYHKGENLFCLDLAKEHIRKEGCAILVEGYMDAIAVYQAGFRNVVASLGTSLTRGQVKRLTEHTKTVYLNYDADSAGINATKRAVPILLEEGFKILVPELTPGEDPDSFIRKNGEKEYRKRLESSLDGIDFVVLSALEGAPHPSDEQKLQALNQGMPLLASIKSRLLRESVISRLASRLGFREDLILDELRFLVNQGRKSIPVKTLAGSKDVTEAELRLLRAVVGNPKLRQTLGSEFEAVDLSEFKTREVFQLVFAMQENGPDFSYQTVLDALKTVEQKNIFCRVHFLESMEVSEEEARECIKALRKKNLERQLSGIQRMIEASGSDGPELDVLLLKKMELKRLVNNL
jgi:DNA primase